MAPSYLKIRVAILALTTGLAAIVTAISIANTITGFQHLHPQVNREPAFLQKPMTTNIRRECNSLAKRLQPMTMPDHFNKRQAFVNGVLYHPLSKSFSIIPFSNPYDHQVSQYRSEYFQAGLDIVHTQLTNPESVVNIVFLETHDRPFPKGTRLTYELLTNAGLFSANLPSSVTQDAADTVTFHIPLQGDPQKYPLDQYSLSIESSSIQATIPSLGVYFFKTDLNTPEFVPTVGVHALLYPGMFIDINHRNSCSIPAVIMFTRDNPLHIWLLLAIPVILFALIFESITSLAQQRHKADSADTFAILGIGVAFISVLSLRTELVPSQITAPTLVDAILSSELALFVLFLSSVRVLTRIRVMKKPNTSP